MTTNAAKTSTLDYANPSALRPRFDLYRATLACGAVPLITGVAVFTLWYATRWRWLQGVGLLVIFAGIAAFLAGCAMLVLHIRSRLRTGIERRSRVLARAALASALLLVNFPAAFVCFEAAWFLETQFTLVVTNAGTATVNSFVVAGPGISHEFGPLPPGASAKHSFHVTADGALTFSTTTGQTASAGEVAGYVTRGMGGDTRITIDGSGVTVRDPWNSQ